MAHDVTFVSANTENREAIARTVNDINRQAEDKARKHRLDLDTVVRAGLHALKQLAVEHVGGSREHQNGYLRGYVFLSVGLNTTENVSDLIAEVERSLSPVVRGE